MSGKEANPNNDNKEVIFETCAPFTDFTSEINDTQIDSAEDNDIVISVLNLIEYSINYSKTLESLWKYHSDEPFLGVNDAMFLLIMLIFQLLRIIVPRLNLNQK